jgi:hypothetical protein
VLAASVLAEPGELVPLPTMGKLRRLSTALKENRPPSGWRGNGAAAPAAYVGGAEAHTARRR